MTSIIVDVREKDEYDAEHVEHSIHIPLSSFEKLAPAIFRTLEGKKVLLLCRSGKRASLAQQQCAAFTPKSTQVEILAGGILEWKNQNKPVVTKKKARLPLMRQVQLTVGLLVLTSVALSQTINPAFIWLAGFCGAGLTVAGATGFCGMAELLARMPWNRNKPESETCTQG